MTAPAAARGGPPAAHQRVRDFFGFAVKPELEELYLRFAPIYKAEEAERCCRWDQYIQELQEVVPSLPGEDDAALLQRALSHLGASTRAGEAPPQAAALLQRLSSLVQAGVPMARRGAFWRLFLNIDSKRRQGEYQQLLGEVAELERMQNRFDGDSSSSGGGEQGGCYGAAAAAKAGGQQQQQQHHPPGAVVSLVADGRRGSSGGAGSADATAAAAAAAAASYHRIDVFSITRLDESPECTPLKQPAAAASGQDDAGCSGTGEGLGSTAAEAMSPLHTTPLAGLAASGLAVTPASTLTPLACDTGSSASSGTQADGGSEGAVSMGRAASSLLGSAERWRQQDFMAQIDKDLHRTFPGHPCMDAPGRAALRRILAACARRTPSVGYCQGLNFLAATFLLLLPEEDAFWCLCALVEDLLGPSYFDERMVAPQVDSLVFGHLLQGGFPTLWHHLASLDVDAASVTMQWFLVGFLNSLPLDSVLRVWDLLFFEGSPVVLFRVALALIEIYEQALMCTLESSDAYMLLQCCAQMTFDSSRLVDTASIGYSHLQPAGLQVLRQRYRPAVLDNLRCSFPSDEVYSQYVSSQQASPNGSSSCSGSPGGAGAGRSFAATFLRVSSAVLEAEEAAQRQQAALAADGGHLSAPSSRAGSSRQSSPGSGSAGSQPASPLVRMRQAVTGLTSRLMPSALPMLLPAGAMSASGQELSPTHAGQQPLGSLSAAPAGRRGSSSAAAGSPAGGNASEQAASAGSHHLRSISIGGRSDASGSSPTARLSHSASSGAALGRNTAGLTPFSEVHPDFSWTPQRPPAGGGSNSVAPGSIPVTAAAAAPGAVVAKSQPATPTGLLLGLGLGLPPGSQRRALTAGYPASQAEERSRRRRRLTIDLINLAELKPDLQQPALAAAFAIAANPSPRGGGAAGGGQHSGSSQRLRRSAPAVSPLGLASVGGGGGSMGSFDELLPVRTLHFGDVDAAAAAADGGGFSGVRRSATAPAAVLLAPADEAAVAAAPPLTVLLAPRRRHTTDDAAADAGGSPRNLRRSGTIGGSCEAAADSPGSAAPAALRQPLPSPGKQCQSQQQQAPALVAVVAQLQEEVSVAESRRHAAELEAQQAQQTAADLRQQLSKVQKLVAAKEALLGELAGKLEASMAATAELSGELRAKQMAVEAEEQQAELLRRQVAAADALIRRLMDAVALAGRRGGAANGGASSLSLGSISSGEGGGGGGGSVSSGSPQSSSGSAVGGCSR